MNTKEIGDMADVHEGLGDRYLLLMKLHGVRRPPVVGWMTGPRGNETYAVVLWEDGEPQAVEGDRRELAENVAGVVLDRLGSGN